MAVPVTAVCASDQVTRDGALSYLHASKRVKLLPRGAVAGADAVVVFATEVTEATLQCMQSADRAAPAGVQIVMVANAISEHYLPRALKFGLVSFLPRAQTNMGQVLRVVLNTQDGRATLPDSLIRSLIDQINALQRNVLEPSGMDLSGLKAREISVLTLLADGPSTAKIAEELNYSERTIKNILSGMMLRLGLHNRVHAISYAIRTGAV